MGPDLGSSVRDDDVRSTDKAGVFKQAATAREPVEVTLAELLRLGPNMVAEPVRA